MSRHLVSASSSPQLREHLIRELELLGVKGVRTVKGHEGRVSFRASPEQLWRLAHYSRLADSLRVSASARPMRARTYRDLGACVKRVQWHTLLQRKDDYALPTVRAKSKGSKFLMNCGDVAARCANYLSEALGIRVASTSNRSEKRLDEQREDEGLRPHVLVSINGDQVEFMVDASGDGEEMHMRGYRKHVGDAPLRETTAAACVHCALEGVQAGREAGRGDKADSGQGPGEGAHDHSSISSHSSGGVGDDAGPLVIWDPFCGSGTIPIEAASMVAGVPCSASRGDKRHGFEAFPTHNSDTYSTFLSSLYRAMARLQVSSSAATVRDFTDADADADADADCDGDTVGLVAAAAAAAPPRRLPSAFTARGLWCIGSDVDFAEVDNAAHNAERAFSRFGFSPDTESGSADLEVLTRQQLAHAGLGAEVTSSGGATGDAPSASPWSASSTCMSFVTGDFERIEPHIPRGAVIVGNLPYGQRVSFRDGYGEEEPQHKALKRLGRMLLRRPDFEHVYLLVRASETAELRKAMPTGVRSTGGKAPRFPLGKEARTVRALNWEMVSRVNNNGVKCQLVKLVRQHESDTE